MAPLSLTLTDQELTRKIQSSVLAEDQKRELTTLLPQMTGVERIELAKMIDDSVRDMIAADPELQKKVRALNEEYDLKIHELVAEQSRHVRREFEKLGTQDEPGTMQSLEGEMEQAGAALPLSSRAAPLSSRAAPLSSRAPRPAVDTAGQVEGSKPKHHVLKLLFILAGLAILVGLILFGWRLFSP